MDDYISRQAAIDICANAIDLWHGQLGEGALIAVRDKIKELPPAQPEIVHCKDCRYSEYDTIYGERYCHYDGKAEIVSDEHYCGYGKERQDG